MTPRVVLLASAAAFCCAFVDMLAYTSFDMLSISLGKKFET